MSLLSYEALCDLLDRGVLEGSKLEHVNAASIDLVLGDTFWMEVDPRPFMNEGDNWPIIDMLDKSASHLVRAFSGRDGVIVPPGGVVLAQTVEVFHLPNWISAEYKLKSTQARNFFNHLTAGWADAGWNGSVLTLEFVNHNRFHSVHIKPGMKCGQMIFFEHEEVPPEASYAVKGRYNNDKTATPGKGLR